jgi:hypothetical protein
MIIPNDYISWKHCISVDCGIELNKEFLQNRLLVLSDSTNQETKKMVLLYGQMHIQNLIKWMQQALYEFK